MDLLLVRAPRLQSAGDVDRYAGDEVGVGGGEKADDACLVPCLGDGPEGRTGDFLGLLVRVSVLPPGRETLRQGQAGRDRVDGDAEGPQLESELLRERDDSTLGGGVGAAARGAQSAPGDRRQV